MKRLLVIAVSVIASCRPIAASVQDAVITVRANEVQHRVSRYLTGACIEDVNHEIYGGIDSQMIFGESFAEGTLPIPFKRFYDLRWPVDCGR